MRLHRLLLRLLPACLPVVALASEPPRIAAVSRLSSAPTRYSQGAGGPINRLAFDVSGIEAADVEGGVGCRYASGLRYRCHASAGPATTAARRVVVEIPDLNLGHEVWVRFANAAGAVEHRVEILNPSHTLHEIESFQLPGGGAVSTGPDGARARVDTLRTWQTTSAPALLIDVRQPPDGCDVIHARWVGASATDPVFASEFGALNGAVAELKPVAKNSLLRADNLPLWLVTYAASATRLQFIAHYEVTYKVGLCADRVIR